MNIALNAKSGTIFVKDELIAPLDIGQFKASFYEKFVSREEDDIPPELRLRGFYLGTVELNSKTYELRIRYRDEKPYSATLSPNEGIAITKGWDTTQEDLLADMRSLTKMVRKLSGQAPQISEERHNIFSFFWGDISVIANFTAMYVKLDWLYKKPNT